MKQLSEEAIRAIEELEGAGSASTNRLAFCQRMWNDSRRLFWLYLENSRRRKYLLEKWTPRLRDYAGECRRIHPAPSKDGLTAAQQAQHGLLTEWFLGFR